ncbi:MAG: DUF4037 domain-containing protein [Planctomycetaceae bacterium]|nr:DUF4037 domain-containing protein [Planctomycetaceae bacterium]
MNIPNPDLLEAITSAFADIDEVKALVLSGSSLTRYGDERSDYDFYVYADTEIDRRRRTEIAERFAASYTIDNHFYETDDEWLLPESGKQVEFIYRNRNWIEGAIRRVWVDGEATLGYTTCLVFNVQNSRILHDPESWFSMVQDLTCQPYPPQLVQNIIAKNIPMLYGRLNGSFREQILNAVTRDDLVAVNHRISVFLASYFDVLFALNNVLCPGEKHLVQYALDTCRTLPASFKHEVESLITAPVQHKPVHLDHLVEELRRLVAKNG